MKTLEQLKAQFGDIAQFLTTEIGEQFDRVDAALQELVRQLRARPAEELAALRKDVKEMIDFVTRRSDAADGERFKYLQSSLQVIGFILVIFGLALSGLDKTTAWSPIVLASLVSVGFALVVAGLGSLVIVVMYFAQARFRYPFVYYSQLGNSWRWFYYGNVDPETPEGEFFYRNRDYQQRYARAYATDLERYLSRYIRDPLPEQIISDLRQLFLLIEHDRYKQRFKQHMVHAALYTGCAALAAFIGGLIGSYWVT